MSMLLTLCFWLLSPLLYILAVLETLIRLPFGVAKVPGLPGYRGFFIAVLQNLKLFYLGPLEFTGWIYRTARANGGSYFFYYGPIPSIFLADAHIIDYVMAPARTDLAANPKATLFFKTWLGHSLITVPAHSTDPGQNEWRGMRHRTMPVMNLPWYEDIMKSLARDQLVVACRKNAREGVPMNLFECMLHVSSKIVIMAFMGLPQEVIPEDVYLNLNKLFSIMRVNLFNPLALTNVDTPSKREFRKLRDHVREFVLLHLPGQREAATMFGSVIRANMGYKARSSQELYKYLNEHTQAKLEEVKRVTEYYESVDITKIGTVNEGMTDTLYRFSTDLASRFKNNEERYEKALFTLEGKPCELSHLIECFLTQGCEVNNMEKLMQEIVSNLIGGSETTIIFMTFCCYYLASNPEVQTKLRTYLKESTKSGETILEQIRKGYLGWVLNETLRITSPAFLNNRHLLQDTEFEGRTYPRFAIPWSSQFYLQRDERYWPEPLKFIPERWEKNPVPGSYFPFGSGQRLCIGKEYAKLEAAITVSALVNNFEIRHSDPNYVLEIEAEITLRPKKPILLSLKALGG